MNGNKKQNHPDLQSEMIDAQFSVSLLAIAHFMSSGGWDSASLSKKYRNGHSRGHLHREILMCHVYRVDFADHVFYKVVRGRRECGNVDASRTHRNIQGTRSFIVQFSSAS